MKFLCDRCKTRYSIGDDRVRGKILKIRCKNCANVITVREGMTDADAGVAEAAGPRRNAKPTTLAPPVATASPSAAPNGAPAGALGAAFASAMTRPPPALEEEWYVSIDGDQEGPYSLAEAQRWISGKTFDADLHCWSEGFDDWLPVDKVSHFRGIRKKPAPAPAPPPLPRITGGVPALRAQTRQVVEEEPKPLFAATMASLERNVAAQPAAGLGPGMARPSATPPRGESRYPTPLGGSPSIQAKTNGTGPAKVPAVAPMPATSKSGPTPRTETRPGVGSSFDVGDSKPHDGGVRSKPEGFAEVDQATQIEAPAFEGEAQTAAEPVAARAKAGVSALTADPAPAIKLANAPVTVESEDDDDDGLSIGEVSRVVKLADLMRPPPKKPEAIAAASRRTQSSPSLARTGAVARMGNTASVVRVEDPNAPAGAYAPGGDPSVAPGAEMAMQPAPAETSHKKGMIVLLGVSVVLLAGVIIAVVTLAGGGDTSDKGLGHSEGIDTTRPDDPLRPRLPGDTGSGSAVAANPFFPPKTPTKRPNGNPTQPNGSNTVNPELPTGDSLSPEDIDTVSKKYSTGTQRCYMRSQKGVDAITVGAVKSIQATLTVGKDGAVTEVVLGSHGDDTLGKCLSQALKGWRFRANPGGRVKFTLAFAQE